MKKVIIFSSIVALVLITSCNSRSKDHNNRNSIDTTTITNTNPLLAHTGSTNVGTSQKLYVTASSGLSLRAGSNLNSTKVLTMPYGAQLEFLSSPKDTEMVVAGIEGKMLKVTYQGAQGYAFDGYISALSPPQDHENIEAYAQRIHRDQDPAAMTKTANKKGENYGMTTSIEIPSKNWSETYKIAERLFNLPKSLRPNFRTPLQESLITNKNKRERTFKDELAVIPTNNGSIKKMVYTYKLKDYSRTVTVTKELERFKIVEVEESF